MRETLLIGLSDIEDFKGISSNVNSFKDLQPSILEAQEFDLKKIMGESFYLDLMDDFEAVPSLTKYGDLFNGVQYTYNGNKYEHAGIRAVLAYHSYARYVPDAQTQSTASGFVKKTNQYSEHVSDKSITRKAQQARSGAQAHWDDVRRYLERKSTDYPLFKCGKSGRYKSGIKIKRIG
jgi:hypothetical protein